MYIIRGFLFLLLLATSALAGEAKYIFLFIGDGTSMPQISATEMYRGITENGEISYKKLGFTQFPAFGAASTYNYNSFITDSASAATAMAAGHKSRRGAINRSPNDNSTYIPFTYDFKKAGLRVGIVTSVSLNHATPAGFYAKSTGRGDAYNIALMMLDSGFDYFGGGGIDSRTGRDNDKPDVIGLLRGKYTVATTAADIQKLQNGAKAVAINEVLVDNFMPYEIDRTDSDMSLADHTRKAIEVLESDAGFFLMVEGGSIDHACHANDAATTVREVVAFDDAVMVAYEFWRKHPDNTLIIVTGDHETGGMSVGRTDTKYTAPIENLGKQKGSYKKFLDDVFEPYRATHTENDADMYDMQESVLDFFDIDIKALPARQRYDLDMAFRQSMKGMYDWRDERLYKLYGGNDAFTNELLKIFSIRAGIGWTSSVHTALPVPVFAIGAGAEHFSGYYDNTDIYHKLKEVVLQPD